MSKHPNDIQTRAPALAQSGKFVGWKAVAFELRFEPGYEEGAEWILSPAAKDEIDSLCQARAKRRNAA
jgi:hypothetical protein